MRSLEESHRLPCAEFFENFNDCTVNLAVIGEELFVAGVKSGPIDVYSLAGDHLRTIGKPWGTEPGEDGLELRFGMCGFGYRLCLSEMWTDRAQQALPLHVTRAKRIWILTNEGNSLQPPYNLDWIEHESLRGHVPSRQQSASRASPHHRYRTRVGACSRRTLRDRYARLKMCLCVLSNVKTARKYTAVSTLYLYIQSFGVRGGTCVLAMCLSCSAGDLLV